MDCEKVAEKLQVCLLDVYVSMMNYEYAVINIMSDVHLSGFEMIVNL